jgi:hypothetical protein
MKHRAFLLVAAAVAGAIGAVAAGAPMSAEERHPRLSPSPPEERQASVPVVHRERPREVEPAYCYLGSFGRQENPIFVFKGNGDVVNVPFRKP